MNKLLASLLIAAASTLAVNAIAATDKANEPTTTTHPDKKAKKSHDNHKKQSAKKAETKPAEQK